MFEPCGGSCELPTRSVNRPLTGWPERDWTTGPELGAQTAAGGGGKAPGDRHENGGWRSFVDQPQEVRSRGPGEAGRRLQPQSPEFLFPRTTTGRRTALGPGRQLRPPAGGGAWRLAGRGRQAGSGGQTCPDRGVPPAGSQLINCTPPPGPLATRSEGPIALVLTTISTVVAKGITVVLAVAGCPDERCRTGPASH